MNQKSVRLPAKSDALAHAGVAEGWLDLDRVRVYSAALLVLFAALLITWGWVSKGFSDATISRPGSDFSVFWGASHLALTLGPLHAYDVGQLTAVIAQYGTLGKDSTVVLPWLYPPTFLLMVLPLSLLPLAQSYLLFLLATGAIYLKSVAALLGTGAFWRRGLWLPVIASPATIIAAVMGQNSLLTAGLAAFAVYWVEKRPVLAGVLIGMLAIKPQLAMLFPLALVAARAWKTFASAALTAALFAATSVAVCGWETVPAFLENAQWARTHYMEGGVIAWYGMPTPLAAARLGGVGIASAYAVQALVALGGVAALVYVWHRTPDFGLRAGALVITTMLATPYLRDYELTWLGVAIAGVVGDGIRHGLSRGERMLLVLAWLLPLFEHANPFLKLPQFGPLILMAMLLLILRRVAGRT
ncbi:glycosyltransferase family 87 protein [Ralstonia sp. UBA689]|uniref:glycosyltransferase family 87 protein n=1 Tax=Ralstonia sp. UBA689 TaxID=1947373 RepID=UPI0025F1F084|nr:glycosyltransferase family 87 protein [Ralstonia sp. UBA689]